MKKTTAIFFLVALFGSTFSYAKHPQCAGSYEPEKCNRIFDDLAKETPAQRQERIKRLSQNKAATDKAVSNQPNYRPPQSTEAPRIGMSKSEAIESAWGRPKDINKTTTSTAVREQWVYDNSRYLYFVNGALTAIQE